MLAGGALLVSSATSAAEVTITVTNLGDGVGSCSGSGTAISCPSLRTAVLYANELPDPVVIQLGGGTYTLTTLPADDDSGEVGDLDVRKRGGQLRIQGAGSAETTISGEWTGKPDRLFDIGAGSTLLFDGVTLTRGVAEDGGALWIGGVVELNDVVFFRNKATRDGGAIFLAANGMVRVPANAEIVTFEENEAGVDGEKQGNGGAIATQGALVLEGPVTFVKNAADGRGGAIWVQGGRTTLMGRVVVGYPGNQATSDGGGIAVADGEVDLQGSMIRGNQAEGEGRGGGLWVERGQVTLRRVQIRENEAKHGGGLALDQGTLTILDSEIRGNVAENDGGGLAIVGKGNAQIASGTIAENRARTGNGGGLVNQGTLSLSRSLIEGNTAEAGAGGGILNAGTLTLSAPEQVIVQANRASTGGGLANLGQAQLRSLVVASNSATSDGGGVWNEGELILESSTVEKNTTEGSGGGIYHRGGKQLTVAASSLIRSNQALLDGGGVFAAGKAAIVSATIQENVAGGSGGGVIAGQQVDFQRVQLHGNHAGRDGGSLLVMEDGKVTLIDTAVRSSQADELGGGIAVRTKGQLSLQASSITENRALAYGGGLAVFGTVGATNVTISTNVSQQNGGGIWAGPGATVSLQFTTLAQNAASAGGALYNDGGTVSLRGVLIAESPGGGNCGGLAPSSQGVNLEDRDSCLLRGVGDLVNVPANILQLQVDPGGGTLFHALGVVSAARDAAGTQNCPSDDQLHTKRPQGDACDIGAFEYPIPEVNLTPTPGVTQTPGTPTLASGLTPSVSATPILGPVTTTPAPSPTPTIGLPATGWGVGESSSTRAVGFGLLSLGTGGLLVGGVSLLRGSRRRKPGEG